MEDKKRLYVACSYFHFFQSLVLAYENINFEKACIILFRLDTDKTDYKWLISYLKLEKKIEIFIINDRNYKKMYSFVFQNRKKILRDKIYLADESDTKIHLFFQIFITKNIEILGDGAGLIWDDEKQDNLKTKIKFMPFKVLFNAKLPYELSQTRDRDFFKKKWKFFKDCYGNLEVKNECWIFGTSIPFVTLYSLECYSALSREFFEKGGWKEKDYVGWMEKLVAMFSLSDISHKYYPHPLEQLSDFTNVNFCKKDTYSEFLPFKLGYMPKYIFNVSTSAFNFLSIANSIDSEIKIYVFQETDAIDDVYKLYGAKIYYPGDKII